MNVPGSTERVGYRGTEKETAGEPSRSLIEVSVRRRCPAQPGIGCSLPSVARPVAELVSVIRAGLAAAGQCGPQRYGYVIKRRDRAVGEGQPDRRDPVGGEDQELEAVAVEA